VQQLTPPLVDYQEIIATDSQDVELRPQAGRIWEILELYAQFIADATVQSRVVSIGLVDADGGDVSPWIQETIAASGYVKVTLGMEPHGFQGGTASLTYLGREKLWLWNSKDGTKRVRFKIGASNKAAGDRMRVRALYKEYLDFNVK